MKKNTLYILSTAQFLDGVAVLSSLNKYLKNDVNYPFLHLPHLSELCELISLTFYVSPSVDGK